MGTPWKSRYAQRSQRMGRSVIRELLKFAVDPEIISFAGGLPAPELFPVAQIQEAACNVLSQHGAQALQYGQTEGYLPLRQYICERMNRYGIKAEPANVFITTGSQQALDLIGKLLINPGDRVLVEEPTYLGALLGSTRANTDRGTRAPSAAITYTCLRISGPLVLRGAVDSMLIGGWCGTSRSPRRLWWRM